MSLTEALRAVPRPATLVVLAMSCALPPAAFSHRPLYPKRDSVLLTGRELRASLQMSLDGEETQALRDRFDLDADGRLSDAEAEAATGSSPLDGAVPLDLRLEGWAPVGTPPEVRVEVGESDEVRLLRGVRLESGRPIRLELRAVDTDAASGACQEEPLAAGRVPILTDRARARPVARDSPSRGRRS